MIKIAPLLIVSLWMVGCMPTIIDRAQLDEHYEQTTQAKGVLSAVPLRFDPAAPPTVVNWWYAGTRKQRHYLVCRELTWDQTGKPIGKESWYRVPATQLTVRETFDKTRNDAKWLPLHEAAAGVPPPADLPTSRLTPDPIKPDAVEPYKVKPGNTRPHPTDPLPIEPADQ